jgi:hypothetical protein
VDFWKDAFVPVVAAAIGTGVGATVAFFIERSKRTRAIEDEHVTATNIALFTLFQIVNDLTEYRRQHIEPYRDDPERWYTLPPTQLPEPPKFDASTLSYLFEVPGDAPTLPMAVHVGIGKYESISETAKERYRIHMHEVQPALEVARRNLDARLGTKKQIDTILGGSRITDTMQVVTNDLVMMIDDALDYIPKHSVWLRDVAKKKYPKRQIIQLLIPSRRLIPLAV